MLFVLIHVPQPRLLYRIAHVVRSSTSQLAVHDHVVAAAQLWWHTPCMHLLRGLTLPLDAESEVIR